MIISASCLIAGLTGLEFVTSLNEKSRIMKQFSLEEYLKNPKRKVITRGGRPVRIICTDKCDTFGKLIIALIKCENGIENIHTYTSDVLF